MATRTIQSEKNSGEGRSRYLETLGLKPGASSEQIHTTYFMLIKRSPENPTEEEETRLHAIKHAYGMLRRGSVPAATRPAAAVPKRRLLVPALAGAALLLTGVLLGMNYGEIKMKLTHYPAGAVLRLKTQSEPYGKVVGFEPGHRFATGNPSAAYFIRLAHGEETVWVSERVVVNAMAPVSSER